MTQLLMIVFIVIVFISCSGCNKHDEPIHQTEDTSAISSESYSSSTNNQPQNYNVHFIAKERIKDHIKNPSSAEFPSITDIQITNRGDGVWTVLGYVDAKNSFGATVRTKYKVEMEAQPNCDDYNMMYCWKNINTYY